VSQNRNDDAPEQQDDQKKKTETQPLNLPRRYEDDDEPRATVLTDAQNRADPPPGQDTERVRLVPRVPDPPSWRVIFHTIAEPPSIIGLDVRQSLIVGRLDPDFDEQPDLDLSPHLGLDYGVSRRHAALIPAPDGLYLMDLGSKNGTWLNGLYAEPSERYLLSPNDQVEFGLMKLVVRTVTLLGRSADR
jgi:hypothetical protein